MNKILITCCVLYWLLYFFTRWIDYVIKNKKVITRSDGRPYLVRYRIFECRAFKIRVHHILLSDPDCLHDHPWDFVSIILKGGYWEMANPIPMHHPPGLMVPQTSKWYGKGKILFRKANWKHRLQIPYKKTTWTFVIMFRRKREWGFWTKNGFVNWENYGEEKCD